MLKTHVLPKRDRSKFLVNVHRGAAKHVAAPHAAWSDDVWTPAIVGGSTVDTLSAGGGGASSSSSSMEEVYAEITARVNATVNMNLEYEDAPRLQLYFSGVSEPHRTLQLEWHRSEEKNLSADDPLHRATTHWGRTILPVSPNGSWTVPRGTTLHAELLVRSPAEDGIDRMYVPAGNSMWQFFAGDLEKPRAVGGDKHHHQDVAVPSPTMAPLAEMRETGKLSLTDEPLMMAGMMELLSHAASEESGVESDGPDIKATLDMFVRFVAINPRTDMAAARTIADYGKHPERSLKRATTFSAAQLGHSIACAKRIGVDVSNKYDMVDVNMPRVLTEVLLASSARLFPYQPYVGTASPSDKPVLAPHCKPWQPTSPELASYHLGPVQGAPGLVSSTAFWWERPHAMGISVNWEDEERRFLQAARVTAAQLDMTEAQIIDVVQRWEEFPNEKLRAEALQAGSTQPHGKRSAQHEAVLELFDEYQRAVAVLHESLCLGATSYPYMGDGTYRLTTVDKDKKDKKKQESEDARAAAFSQSVDSLPTHLHARHIGDGHYHGHHGFRRFHPYRHRHHRRGYYPYLPPLYLFRHCSNEYFCGDQRRMDGGADCEDSGNTIYRDSRRLLLGNPQWKNTLSGNAHHREGGWRHPFMNALQRMSHHYCRFGVVGSVTAKYLGEKDKREKKNKARKERERRRRHHRHAGDTESDSDTEEDWKQEAEELRGEDPVKIGSKKDTEQASIGGHSWTVHIPMVSVLDSLLDRKSVVEAIQRNPKHRNLEKDYPKWGKYLPRTLGEGTSSMEVRIEPLDQRFMSTRYHEQLLSSRERRAHTMLHVSRRLLNRLDQRLEDGVVAKRLTPEDVNKAAAKEAGSRSSSSSNISKRKEKENEEDEEDEEEEEEPEADTVFGSLWRRRIQSRCSDSKLERWTTFYRDIASMNSEDLMRMGLNVSEFVPAIVKSNTAATKMKHSDSQGFVAGTAGAAMRRLLERETMQMSQLDAKSQGDLVLVTPPGFTSEEIAINYESLKHSAQPIYPVLDEEFQAATLKEYGAVAQKLQQAIQKALPHIDFKAWPKRSTDEWETGDLLHYYVSFTNNTFVKRKHRHSLFVEELVAMNGQHAQSIQHMRIDVEPLYSPNSGTLDGLVNVTVHYTLKHVPIEKQVKRLMH